MFGSEAGKAAIPLRFTRIVGGMVVYADRMMENLGRSRGVVFSGSVLLELARLVLEITESTSDLLFAPLPADDPRQRRPDISLAESTLGWYPAVELRDGLVRTHEWYRRTSGGE